MALSRNQANTVKALKEMVEQGQPVCRETLALAHREGYFHLKDADSSVVSDYVAKNLKKSELHRRARIRLPGNQATLGRRDPSQLAR